MPRYFAALTIVLMLGMVLTRALLMKRKGIKAMHFGKIDKTDFLIPPFAFFYFYVVFAAAFHWPTVSRQEFFQSWGISWVGVLFCLAGLLAVVASYVAERMERTRHSTRPSVQRSRSKCCGLGNGGTVLPSTGNHASARAEDSLVVLKNSVPWQRMSCVMRHGATSLNRLPFA